MTATDPTSLATGYFDAWRGKDPDALRAVLADEVDFAGPMARVTGADACIEGLSHLAEITTRIDVQHRFVDGDDVLTWFELHTAEGPPMPVANWSHVRDGRIARIRVTFDPRPLLG